MFFESKALLALILFVLQFGQGRDNRFGCHDEDDEIHNCRPQLIDNSIHFIIALAFLCCCLNDKKKCCH